MHRKTLGQRLETAMKARGLSAAELGRLAETTKETIGNWIHDRTETDHVKAAVLFRIANAVGLSGYELLYDEPEPAPAGRVQEPAGEYTSHPMQLDSWKIAFQLVAEALDDRGLALPPEKRAQVTLLAYELLREDMPRAKVLRFVQAAAA